MKTDNAELVGKHVFEAAGLGAAPFRFMGVNENMFKMADGTSKPGGTCNYCGTGIRWEFCLRSADGKKFVVGSECINKSGDKGLIKAYKNSREYREIQAAKRAALDAKKTEEIDHLIKTEAGRLFLLPAPDARYHDNALDYAAWMMRNCGAAGRGRLLRWLRSTINVEITAEMAERVAILAAERESTRIAGENAQRMLDAQKRARIERLEPIAAKLDDGMGGFRQSIAVDMRDGRVPTGKARTIDLDILGKQAGRYNSKAYWAAIEAAENIFEEE